ncbi:MAG: hypothetical protein ACRDTT_05765 [Pseudonocardiaceae bacterium]
MPATLATTLAKTGLEQDMTIGERVRHYRQRCGPTTSTSSL